MLKFYQKCTRHGENLLIQALQRREKAGKEDSERLDERMGQYARKRPSGALIWLHAASVGESQSALILINALLQAYPKLNILVTTGTRTSATMMAKNLPEQAFHQFYPLDHPEWIKSFLDHWDPNFIFWMESELWPNMLLEIQQRQIPATLINARLSPGSYKKWRLFRNSAQTLLQSFSAILCQTEQDAAYFKKLGAANVHITDNLKYNAAALPASDDDLKTLNVAIQNRPCWVYASTHAGEEALAARTHEMLKSSMPDILTIIVPRHPERRNEIQDTLKAFDLGVKFRGTDKDLPDEQTNIYVADTLGELGLFYRAAPIACIGRTFSDDGGGGHNPIEAAQLHCAVLHGPHVQNLRQIFIEMDEAEAALPVHQPEKLASRLHELLTNQNQLETLQNAGQEFARSKAQVLERVMHHVQPLLDDTQALDGARE